MEGHLSMSRSNVWHQVLILDNYRGGIRRNPERHKEEGGKKKERNEKRMLFQYKVISENQSIRITAVHCGKAELACSFWGLGANLCSWRNDLSSTAACPLDKSGTANSDFSLSIIQCSLHKRSIIKVHGSESSRNNMGYAGWALRSERTIWPVFLPHVCYNP